MEQSDSVYCYKKRNLEKKVAAENIFCVHFFARWKSLDKDWIILISSLNLTKPSTYNASTDNLEDPR